VSRAARRGSRWTALARSCGWAALALLPFAGCATLSPSQARNAADVRVLADRTARVYGLPPIHFLVNHDPDSPPGSFRPGYFSISAVTLESTFRDAIVAHELAHYVLGHDAPLPGDTDEERRAAYQQRELDANAKSVEILVRAGGMTQKRALRTVYAYLDGIRWALERHPGLKLSGHKLPCEEIADLLSRFPRERAWTAGLECGPGRARSATGAAGG
jgi:hypothetical protein